MTARLSLAPISNCADTASKPELGETTNMATTSVIATVIGERDSSGRYWLVRLTKNGLYDVLPRKFRRRDAAIRAAKTQADKVQFWH